MARIATLWSADFATYEPPAGHPERASRNQAVERALATLGDRITRLPVSPAPPEALLAVHHSRYLAELAASESASAAVEFDGDTVATARAYRGALLAAGAAVAAVDAVLGAGYQRAFSLARPPGHHAECDRAMGFCFLNNVAIAAQHAIDRYGCQRVAIVDWDVHHGNGTQRTFEGRSDVLFISSHQAKLFPGTGRHQDRGRGRGLGYTLNLPLSLDATDAELLGLHRSLTLPVLETFAPELLLISAGFDAHERDRTSAQTITSRGFGQLAALLFDAADRLCQGRSVVVLEGGYDLEALESSLVQVLEAALDPRPWLETEAAAPRGKLRWTLDALTDLHASHWPLLAHRGAR
jgi:acetoin utilization deacetylase AcuC-like enzyme